MKKLYIIKIGGNVLDDDKQLEKFISDFSEIKECKILVHGGGKIAGALADKLGIAQTFVKGRRITDAETLDITIMVYAGLINKQIVASLQANGVNALGLSGADGNAIRSTKRKVADIDYGFVGDVDCSGVNADLIDALLSAGITPVFSAITHDRRGQLLNTNADTIASVLAVALSKNYDVQLNYCFEKRGVLKNIDDETSVIASITKEKYNQLQNEGAISKGMIPKLDNAFEAIQNGVKTVVIAHSNELLNTLNDEGHSGTKLIA